MAASISWDTRDSSGLRAPTPVAPPPQAGANSLRAQLERAAKRATLTEVDANNHPTGGGQAYWFDADGLLRASFSAGVTAVFSDFQEWQGKKVPRHVDIYKVGVASGPVATVQVISIDAN
jgi:hypothetical protein